MHTLKIRLHDAKAARLKALAQSRGLSMNKQVEQLSTHALSAWDTENHFRTVAATGNVQQALSVLDRLDALDAAEAKRKEESLQPAPTQNQRHHMLSSPRVISRPQ